VQSVKKLMNRAPKARSRGDAIVEFALLAPCLLLMLFGVLELGRVVDVWVVVHNAAREGARAGVQSRTDAEAFSSAQQAATDYLSAALATRTDIAGVVVPPPTVSPDTVQVTTEVDVQIYTPLIQALVRSPVPVRATTTLAR
jgi:Flp pilus assembly protein TadG